MLSYWPGCDGTQCSMTQPNYQLAPQTLPGLAMRLMADISVSATPPPASLALKATQRLQLAPSWLEIVRVLSSNRRMRLAVPRLPACARSRVQESYMTAKDLGWRACRSRGCSCYV
jgi:hypothetical protein